MEVLRTITGFISFVGGLFGFLMLIGFLVTAFKEDKNSEDE